MKSELEESVFCKRFYAGDGAVGFVETVTGRSIRFAQSRGEAGNVRENQVGDIDEKTFSFWMRLRENLCGSEDGGWKGATSGAVRGSVFLRGESGVQHHPLDLLADEFELERKVAAHLCAVEAAFADRLLDAAGEKEGLFELFGRDLEVNFVFVCFAIEREDALDHLHVLDNVRERLFVAVRFLLVLLFFGGRFFVVFLFLFLSDGMF